MSDKRNPWRSKTTIVVAVLALSLLFNMPGAFADSGDGRLFLSNSTRNRVDVYTPNGSHLAGIPVGVNPRGMATRDGRLYVANRGASRAPGSSITVVDLEHLAPLETLTACEGCAPYWITFDPEGKLWFTSQKDRSIYVTSPPYQVPEANILLMWGWPTEVAPMGESGFLVVGMRDSSDFAVVNTATRKTTRLTLGPTPSSVFSRPGHEEGWVAADNMGFLSQVTLEGETPQPKNDSFKAINFIVDAVFSADGSRIFVSSAKPMALAVFDADTRKLVGHTEFETPPGSIALSPSGEQVAVVFAAEKSVGIVDVSEPETPELVRSFPVGENTWHMLWLP